MLSAPMVSRGWSPSAEIACTSPASDPAPGGKMRINRGQEFVIGGYTPSARSFDALIFGYYDGDRLLYVARTRNGFTPRSRLDIFERLKKLETATCPFANLPETKSGRWGQGLTAAKIGVSLGQARPRWAVRVPGVDAG